MKILWHMQWSSRNDEKTAFDVNTDSNWTGIHAYIKALNQRDNTYEHFCVFPTKRNEIDNAYHDTKYDVVNVDETLDIFSSRGHFDAVQMKKLAVDFTPDIIFENDSCKAYNWRLIIKECNLPSKLVSYNHWLDTASDPKTPIGCSYNIRQVEGFLRSDACLMNSNFAIKEFKDGVSEYFTPTMWMRINGKIFSIYPINDYEQIDSFKVLKNSQTTIMYNHRLASLKQYNVPYKNFIKICDDLAQTLDFQVILSNPTNKKIEERKYITDIGPFSLEQYYEKMWQSHICIGLFEYPGMWSRSLVDGILCNCATLIPKHSGYLELAPYLYSGFVTPETAHDYLKRTINDTDFRDELCASAKPYSIENHCFPSIVKLDSVLKSVLHG